MGEKEKKSDKSDNLSHQNGPFSSDHENMAMTKKIPLKLFSLAKSTLAFTRAFLLDGDPFGVTCVGPAAR